MAQDKEKLVALKNKLKEYELELEKKSELVIAMQSVSDEADKKIKALNQIHADKIRSLMNSINLLKKENKNLEKLTQEASRSKLINQLQKDVQDQDIVIETLRSFLPADAKDRADQGIINALNKGPPQIKQPSREEMKIELKKLRAQVQNGQKGKQGGDNSNIQLSGIEKKQMSLDDENPENKVNESQMSQMSSTQADSIENLIRRLDEFKTENDELKLNLNAQQEIIENYEQEMVKKSEELNNMRSIQTDLLVLTKKYESLQEQYEQSRANKNEKYIKQHDQSLRVEELEIANKQLKSNMRLQEEKQKLDMEEILAKVDDLQNKNEVISKQLQIVQRDKDDQLQKLTDLQERNRQLDKQLKQEVTDKLALQKSAAALQTENSKLKKQIEEQISQLSPQLELKIQELQQAKEQIQALHKQLEEAQGLDYQPHLGASKLGRPAEEEGDLKDIRSKLKETTKRNIELQEQVEQLVNELKFREQQQKVQGYLDKKSGQNIQQEELKRRYQKQVQEQYEAKITKLAMNIKELKQRNAELQSVQKMMGINMNLDNQNKNPSSPSVSLQSIQNYELDDKSQMGLSNALNLQKGYEMVQDQEMKALKKKLMQQMNHEIQLQNKVDELQLAIEQYQKLCGKDQSNKNWESNVQNMKKEYHQVIQELCDKLADQEVENLHLSQMSSNIQSMLSSSDYEARIVILQKMDSNISLSVAGNNYDVQRMSKMSSNTKSVLDSQKDMNYNQQELNDVSSRVSGMSDMNFKRKEKGGSQPQQQQQQNLQLVEFKPSQQQLVSSNLSGMSENEKDMDLNDISSNISKISGLNQ